MKASSRTKVGGRKGNPGYRTQATFRGNRFHDLTKVLFRPSLTKKPK